MLNDSQESREEISEQLSQDVERMSGLVKKLLNLHTVKTKPYVGKSKIIDLSGSSQTKPPDNKSILLIDDDEAILKLLSRIIEKKGFDIESAIDGEKGLSLLSEKDYGLVICDLQLSGISGVDLYQKSREMNKKTPFVFISGYAVEEINEAIIKESAGFLAKPFEPREVFEILDSVFKT